ncbi:hypothetical protein [uncultured Umboniibacter sp.]|uniref:hypothetical protein n=1 Tax=uncultured Umboniibacter sp. TaxID=1798917 RepID=UPI002639D50E|nr:hypothetical protein [uncultured Umboniibacter sp.]
MQHAKHTELQSSLMRSLPLYNLTARLTARQQLIGPILVDSRLGLTRARRFTTIKELNRWIASGGYRVLATKQIDRWMVFDSVHYTKLKDRGGEKCTQ